MKALSELVLTYCLYIYYDRSRCLLRPGGERCGHTSPRYIKSKRSFLVQPDSCAGVSCCCLMHVYVKISKCCFLVSLIMKSKENLEFRALKIFISVVESGSLTEAAKRCGITQSAVSQIVKHLETQTSSELILRRSNPIRLTASGKVFKEYALRTLADTQRVLSDIQITSNNTIALQLNIGMIDSFAEAASQQIVERIKPFASKLSIRTGISCELNGALLNHDLDILVTSDPFENHPELCRYPILRDPFVLIASKKIKKRHAESPKWLAQNVPFIHYNRTNRIGMLVDLIAHRLNIQLNTFYEFDSTQTLLRFVQEGHGWSIVTGLCLIRHPELLRGVNVMPLANGANARHVSLLCHSNELGNVPERLAEICQETYKNDIVPELNKLAPWFEEQAYIINELPPIA